jgi:hypothetical protein
MSTDTKDDPRLQIMDIDRTRQTQMRIREHDRRKCAFAD